MEKTDFTFPRCARLRRSRDYAVLRNKGRKLQSRNFIVYILVREGDGSARLGLTVSRKVGRAVTRNHVKRRVREFFRLHRSIIGSGWELSIVAKPGAAHLDFFQICDELKYLLQFTILKTNS
jgi:ribonuclease P protein component